MGYVIDPNRSAIDNLLDLIARDNHITISSADYELDNPIPFTGDGVPYNTSVVVRASAANTHSGSVQVRYRRLALNECVDHTVTNIVKPTMTESDLIASFAGDNGIIAEELILYSAMPDPKNVAHGSVITLTFKTKTDRSFSYLPSSVDVDFLYQKDPLGDLVSDTNLDGFDTVTHVNNNVMGSYTFPFALA